MGLEGRGPIDMFPHFENLTKFNGVFCHDADATATDVESPPLDLAGFGSQGHPCRDFVARATTAATLRG